MDGPGQFSVRGDIVDIYAPDMHQPARVEYWDDEIDSLALSLIHILLVSVRSGARQSMPGMMDTILNLGLNDEAVEGLAKKTEMCIRDRV